MLFPYILSVLGFVFAVVNNIYTISDQLLDDLLFKIVNLTKYKTVSFFKALNTLCQKLPESLSGSI